MDEHPATAIRSAPFLLFGVAGARAVAQPNTGYSSKPSAKHTVFACTLLLGYLAGYAALGYVVFFCAERAWSAIFR